MNQNQNTTLVWQALFFDLHLYLLDSLYISTPALCPECDSVLVAHRRRCEFLSRYGRRSHFCVCCATRKIQGVAPSACTMGVAYQG